MKKQVVLVNKSPAPITFKLGFTPSNTALNDNRVFRFFPRNEIKLEPKGGKEKIEIAFAPKKRIAQFTEEVLN